MWGFGIPTYEVKMDIDMYESESERNGMRMDIYVCEKKQAYRKVGSQETKIVEETKEQEEGDRFRKKIKSLQRCKIQRQPEAIPAAIKAENTQAQVKCAGKRAYPTPPRAKDADQSRVKQRNAERQTRPNENGKVTNSTGQTKPNQTNAVERKELNAQRKVGRILRSIIRRSTSTAVNIKNEIEK
ncbi:hypothetical protein GALMADRAFT_209823 [Galerina marginata CBS 339.88]|uniref:Uncharacterized protein n=1 Tax=Galerina marginata (strain CBS 339.88) TaxID=685588 RepID=A0A067T588_GALM3|nr:hypothetical protein GALMADRAFT_209823 [Galerina marginata CBS 339.88]